jgi:putative copper export protein
MLLQVHLIAVSFWLGLVAAEVVAERCAKGAAARRTVANVHRWIDNFFEIPIVIVVLVSGGLLLAQVWPGTPLLWAKIGAALIAIVANVICIPLVQARANANDDGRARALTRQIGITGLAIPFLLIAFAIGLELTRPVS